MRRGISFLGSVSRHPACCIPHPPSILEAGDGRGSAHHPSGSARVGCRYLLSAIRYLCYLSATGLIIIDRRASDYHASHWHSGARRGSMWAHITPSTAPHHRGDISPSAPHTPTRTIRSPDRTGAAWRAARGTGQAQAQAQGTADTGHRTQDAAAAVCSEGAGDALRLICRRCVLSQVRRHRGCWCTWVTGVNHT
jgi:hypothetical protein